MKKNHKRISAAVLSLALGFSTAGAGVFAPVAGAQVTIKAGDVSTINIDTPVTLTIEKLVGLPVEDGDTTGMPTLDDAQFEIQKITSIDLETLAGWQDLDALDPTTIPAADLEPIETLTTVSGTASISTTPENNFTVGAYLVTETPPTGYTGADPFIVTLPFADGGVWNYSQTVKPKNQKNEMAEKTVADAGATLGSVIEYTITSPVPAGDIDSLVFTDTLPTELTMDAAQQGAVAVTAGTTTLEAGDFTVGFDAGTNTLTVSLAETGITKAQAAGEIAVTFKATINSLPENDVIANEATVNINDGEITYETHPGGETPEGPTETRLGDLTINKVGKDGETPITTGSAKFELWRCEAEGDGYKVVGDKLSAAVDDNVVSEFTTVDGQASLEGVQVMDWVNGAQVTDSTLCVVETQAPEGYSLNPAPVKVDYTPDTDDNYAMVVDVVNLTEEEAGSGQLPSTGGQGTMALIAAGVLVAAAGGAASVRANRARR